MADPSSNDPVVTKRRVVMTNSTYVGTDTDGNDVFQRTQVVDYVPDDVRDGVNVLQAYLAAVRQVYTSVVVDDEPDAGPAGYDGQTHIPVGFTVPAADDGSTAERHVALQHPLAGQTIPATGEEPPTGGGGAGPSAFATWAGRRATGAGMLLAVQLGLGMLLLSIAALIQTAGMKNTLASSYAATVTAVALYSTAPGAAAGTELAGGTPAYARITPAWGTPTNGVISTSAMVFNVASGSTVAGFGEYNSGGVYQDGASLTSQPFVSQGTYSLTLTYTQT